MSEARRQRRLAKKTGPHFGVAVSDAMAKACFLVSRDRLSPDFRRRVAGLRADCGNCPGCGGPIGTADQIAMALVIDRRQAGMGCSVGMVCRDCAQLPRAKLVERLSIAESAEDDAALFVAHAKMAECAIALSCGLDLEAVEWRVDGEWDYGLRGRFGLVRKESPGGCSDAEGGERKISEQDDVIIVDENDGYFGACPRCGKNDGYLNVGRDHFFVCHEHKKYWRFGSNMFSSWREQTEDERAANAELISGYEEVEPLEAGAWPRDPEAQAKALAERKREREQQVEEDWGPEPGSLLH
jgi:hypothetical protein